MRPRSLPTSQAVKQPEEIFTRARASILSTLGGTAIPFSRRLSSHAASMEYRRPNRFSNEISIPSFFLIRDPIFRLLPRRRLRRRRPMKFRWLPPNNHRSCIPKEIMNCRHFAKQYLS